MNEHQPYYNNENFTLQQQAMLDEMVKELEQDNIPNTAQLRIKHRVREGSPTDAWYGMMAHCEYVRRRMSEEREEPSFLRIANKKD